MKATRPPHSTPEPRDPELSEVLRAWEVDATPGPDFAPAVWRTIARRAEAPSPDGRSPWLAWLAAVLQGPRQAIAYVAVLAVAGAGFGLLQGRASAEAQTAGLQARYVQSIDPFAVHSHHAP